MSGSVFSILIFLFSNKIINFVFGVTYSESIVVLKILSLSILFVFMGNLTTQSLIALDKSKNYLYLSVLGFIVNLTINIILISRYNVIGAAVATVVSECFITLVSIVLVQKYKKEIIL